MQPAPGNSCSVPCTTWGTRIRAENQTDIRSAQMDLRRKSRAKAERQPQLRRSPGRSGGSSPQKSHPSGPIFTAQLRGGKSGRGAAWPRPAPPGPCTAHLLPRGGDIPAKASAPALLLFPECKQPGLHLLLTSRPLSPSAAKSSCASLK